MKITRGLLVLAAFTCSFAASAFAANDTSIQCDTMKFAGKPVSWCHEWEKSSPASEVIYYFHGIGGTEKTWQDVPLRQAMRDALFAQKKSMPHVFTISFGFAWFLTDVKKEKSGSRLDIFLKQVMPALEAKLKKKPTTRILVGESMGGYNALRTAMAKPKSFAKVLALCPAILPIGPYASEAEEQKFIERNPQMNVEMVRDMREWAQHEFPSATDWTRNNPLDRAASAPDTRDLPPALLSDNASDEYGFTEGTAALAKDIADKGGQATLRAQPGNHCQHTPELLKEAAAFVLQPQVRINTANASM